GLGLCGRTGRDLREGRLARARERGIADLTHDPHAQDERLDLVAIEHERGQIVAGPDAIADAGLAVDRRAGEDEIADVAIDRPFRELQLSRDLLPRRHRAAAAEQLAAVSPT